MTASSQAMPGRVRLVLWSALLGPASVIVLWLCPLLALSLLLVPARVGVPLSVRVFRWLRGVADLHRLWAVRVLGTPIPRPYRASDEGPTLDRFRAVVHDPATWRDVRWLPVNATVGLGLVGLPAACLLGAVTGIFAFVREATRAQGVSFSQFGPVHESDRPVVALGAGLLFILVGWFASPSAMRAYGSVLRWFLAPPDSVRLADRIAELTLTRTETLDTQAAEIRRIERDLHDGAQAKLVSLGMNLGMAEKLLVADPAAALRLLAEAKQSTGDALSELRELVRGIQPPILADRGLDGAARALALASPLPIGLSVDLPGRPPAPVESAAYFALTEILTNVVKHSAATSAWVRIGYQHGRLDLIVADNGMGGATTTPGGGLNGIERRLAAFDGTLSVASPVGGPTIVTLEVPCQLADVSS